MPFLIYSITKNHCTEAKSGVNNAAVQTIEVAGLWTHYSRLDVNILPREVEKPEDHPALTFQKVISRIHEQGASLPMQYGFLVGSREELQMLVEANITGIRKELNRIGHTYEYSCHFIRKTVTEHQTPEGLMKSDSPGAQYLLKKYQASQQSTQLDAGLERLSDKMEQLTSEDLIEIKKSSKEGSIRLHLRVTNNRLDKGKLIAQLARDFPAYKAYIFGPYPPSHFVKLGLKARNKL